MLILVRPSLLLTVQHPALPSCHLVQPLHG
jgi:hypothetical protein